MLIANAEPRPTTAADTYLLPIDLDLDPMERLFLYNFEGDAEYSGLELQHFDDPVKGQGWAALMWRRDEKIDFYINPGVTLDREACEVGGGVGEWITQAFDCRVEWAAGGVDAQVDFALKDGRAVHMIVREHLRHVRPPMSILAPMGTSIRVPRYLPIFWLRDIDLLRVSGTDVTLRLGERAYPPSRIPVPVPHALGFVYFVRHCRHPYMLMLNRQSGAPRMPVSIARDSLTTRNNQVLDLRQDGQGWALVSLSRTDGPQHCAIRFSPPLPDVRHLAEIRRFAGRFTIDVDETPGVLAGEVIAERAGDQVTLRLQPTEPWRPTGSFLQRMTLRFFPAVFRTWPLTYRWTARIDLRTQDAGVGFSSGWERIDPAH
jgi:hypothetical protein